jgi:cytochrome c-type biogenesis protein CcmH
MKRLLPFLLLSAALLTGTAQAGDAQPLASDPAVEARLVAIAEDIRCLVCQNESLAGSRAELAEALREEIRRQIAAGQSDAQIKQYLVARYGDFVLYEPPFKTSTLLLWAGPALLLGAGLGGLLLTLRRRQRTLAASPAANTPLSAADAAKAEALLAATDSSKDPS